MANLKRSNVEFSKRVFLDRLTTDEQPLADHNAIDAGPGEEYDYAGVYNPFNFGVGADCSGSAGIFIGAAILGPTGMSWGRQFSTETFPGPFKGFRRVPKAELLSSGSPIKVCIMHGGGGPNSHMNISIDGWVMESNGSHGTCTSTSGAIPQNSTYWNDWWVYDGGIDEDTTWRQPMSYPRGLDYAGGRIKGADLKGAGISFVCRYLTDGGPSLPGKQLLPEEAADLRANGIAIVSNWETYANRMREGAGAGDMDAKLALAQVIRCGGPADGVIYFSCDYDEPENDQPAIDAYLKAAGNVLGGPEHVGIYGGFWPLSRALNAGVAKFAWQTEAWSGGNIDSRINIMQRNALGYQYVGGVQCDINEAHTDYFGQWGNAVAPAPPAPGPGPSVPTPADPFIAWMKKASDRELQEWMVMQLGPGDVVWPSKGMTLRDKVWSLAPAPAKAAAKPKKKA